MIRPKRIPKTLQRRLLDCEAHLRFLADAVRQFQRDPFRYKQIAGELRVLVCKTNTNAPLLLNLMDEIGVVFPVEQEADWPIPYRLKSTGWQDTPRRTLSFREYINDAFRIAVGDRDLSAEDLILLVSQQDGSSHEAPSLDALMAMFGNFLFIGNVPAWAHALWEEGGHTLAAGTALMDKAIAEKGFQPAFYRSRPTQSHAG